MSDERPKLTGKTSASNDQVAWEEIEAILGAGRNERPSATLSDRVLVAVAHRQLDVDAAQARATEPRRRRPWLAGAVAAVVAVAAGATMLLHPRAKPDPLLLGAETAPPAASSSALTGPVAVPVLDPCRHVVVASGRQPMIDDFEDGDDAVLPFEGRVGLWRWVRDTDRPGTAPALLPIPEWHPTPKDKLALHVKGGPLLDWGASVEFMFQPACYDASTYRGIRLRAKGPGRIYVSAREVRLVPPEDGGTCQDEDCYNFHVKKIELTAQYTTIVAHWFEMKQRGYNRPPLDPRQLHSFAVFVRPEDTPYDLWFDEVAFID